MWPIRTRIDVTGVFNAGENGMSFYNKVCLLYEGMYDILPSVRGRHLIPLIIGNEFTALGCADSRYGTMAPRVSYEMLIRTYMRDLYDIYS